MYFQDRNQHENVHRGNKGFICTAMIQLPPKNSLSKALNFDSNQSIPENDTDKESKNLEGQNIAAEGIGKFKPCGRSYSSSKALKDHIKTVHIDTAIYSCHVSIFTVTT